MDFRRSQGQSWNKKKYYAPENDIYPAYISHIRNHKVPSEVSFTNRRKHQSKCNNEETPPSHRKRRMVVIGGLSVTFLIGVIVVATGLGFGIGFRSEKKTTGTGNLHMFDFAYHTTSVFSPILLNPESRERMSLIRHVEKKSRDLCDVETITIKSVNERVGVNMRLQCPDSTLKEDLKTRIRHLAKKHALLPGYVVVIRSITLGFILELCPASWTQRSFQGCDVFKTSAWTQ